MSCGNCRTLYPGIVPESDDICLDCIQDGDSEETSLHDLAVEIEQELEQWQSEPVLTVVEMRGR